MYFIVVIVFFLHIFSFSNSIEVMREECLNLGFNPSIVLCSTCELVKTILSDDATYSSCQSCCIKKEATIEEKYQLAVLEVDKRFLNFYPELEALIKIKSDLKLKVKYRFGYPLLSMYKNKKDSEASEQLSVASWNKDTIADYLKTHLSSV